MHPAKTLAAALLSLGLAAGPTLASAADPTGHWQSTTGESRYKVTYCGDGTQLCARLTWLREDARTEENLSLLNAYVVEGATAVDEGVWQGQLQYEGDTYAGSMRLVSDDTLTLRGCKGMFCQSMAFERI